MSRKSSFYSIKISNFIKRSLGLRKGFNILSSSFLLKTCWVRNLISTDMYSTIKSKDPFFMRDRETCSTRNPKLHGFLNFCRKYRNSHACFMLCYYCVIRNRLSSKYITTQSVCHCQQICLTTNQHFPPKLFPMVGGLHIFHDF